MTTLTLSLIIPFYNEEQNVEPLFQRVTTAMERFGCDYEVIGINDGSEDGTEAILDRLSSGDPRFKVIHFRRNHGQTAALMAGFDHARGDVIIPMDGDLQNDPDDIRHLVGKIEEGYSVVSGWRKDRKDSKLSRTLPSRMANWLISSMFGVHLHDYGCTLKAYRKEVVKDIKLYGEMHRFVPIYASWHGAKLTEIPVKHHPRVHGDSKYGLNRIFKVFLDLMVVKFLEDYHTKPIYVFGIFGLFCIFLSFLSGLLAVYLRFFMGITFIQTPLPLLVVMTFITGVLCILMGLLAEMLVRIYYESQSKPTYFIRKRVNLDGKG